MHEWNTAFSLNTRITENKNECVWRCYIIKIKFGQDIIKMVEPKIYTELNTKIVL